MICKKVERQWCALLPVGNGSFVVFFYFPIRVCGSLSEGSRESQFACTWPDTQGHISFIRKIPTLKPLYLEIKNFAHLVTDTQIIDGENFNFYIFSSLGGMAA